MSQGSHNNSTSIGSNGRTNHSNGQTVTPSRHATSATSAHQGHHVPPTGAPVQAGEQTQRIGPSHSGTHARPESPTLSASDQAALKRGHLRNAHEQQQRLEQFYQRPAVGMVLHRSAFIITPAQTQQSNDQLHRHNREATEGSLADGYDADHE